MRSGVPGQRIRATLGTKFCREKDRTGDRMSESSKFDVFLSHNSRDKSSVRELAQALRDRGLRPWLDEWELIPGRSIQDAQGAVLAETGSIAVLIDAEGIGSWQILELEGFLGVASQTGLSVILVLLPNALESPDLPLFLAGRNFVDLRKGLTDEGLDRLVFGITEDMPANGTTKP